MKLYLASGNAHKAAELQALVAEAALSWEIISARTVGGMPAVEEDTGTFIGNARKKALALRAKLPAGSWVLADDSGLCVDALGGAPGVESAYYAGSEGDGAANLAKLVSVMRDVPESNRGAHFVCVLVVITGDGVEVEAEGRVDGRLLHAPRGGAGFGYDPLFVPAGSSLTMAEMSEMEKNRLSHRHRAWETLVPRLASVQAQRR